MYPQPNPDEGRAAVSQDNARDIVELIDNLIQLRASQLERQKWVNGEKWSAELNEPIELAKRRITDYLLVTDPRAGVFRKPE